MNLQDLNADDKGTFCTSDKTLINEYLLNTR